MPDGVLKIILDLLVVFIFILINAFFAGTEMAVISLNDAKMRKMAEDIDALADLKKEMEKGENN